jgi:hypothetical protein
MEMTKEAMPNPVVIGSGSKSNFLNVPISVWRGVGNWSEILVAIDGNAKKVMPRDNDLAEAIMVVLKYEEIISDIEYWEIDFSGKADLIGDRLGNKKDIFFLMSFNCHCH